ncbi:unnamed protein product [Protopolystoma xenopodis]|uniref:Uncharacterized protein n=1 Tax=Protopolystoma xenopodis TaxID=117903 RepID=A0A448XMU7_9PLAT|nr:unnamed protein product [Protopolystoma xenopodis]
MVLRMVKLTNDADYDAGETSGNVLRPRSDFGNDHADMGPRTRCVPLSLPTNMTKLRKQGQTTSRQRKETATTKGHITLVFIPTSLYFEFCPLMHLMLWLDVLCIVSKFAHKFS